MFPLAHLLLSPLLREAQVRQEDSFSGRMVSREKLKALIKRGAAVVKKAMTIRDNAVVYISPEDGKKKARKRKISLEAAFEKEKKSQGKRRK